MQQTQVNTYLRVESDGFLSRVCYVPVKKSELFLAVHIEDVFLDQLYGEWAFVNLDCKVESHSVLSLIEGKLMEAANNEIQKVKIGFRAELYRNSNCATIKGQLLEILWAEMLCKSYLLTVPKTITTVPFTMGHSPRQFYEQNSERFASWDFVTKFC